MSEKSRYIAKVILAILLISLAMTFAYTPEVNPVALLVIAYTLGSIPFGYILSNLALKKDIRTIGSGNIGATNVLRTGNKQLAALTLFLDAAKGGLAIIWLTVFSNDINMAYTIGFAAILGHLFPVWLNFKGGKGVATGLGLLFVLSWPLALIALAIWLAVILVTKYSSLAALVSIGLLPIIAIVMDNKPLSLFTLALGILIYIRHIGNIKLLLAGKESKVGQRTSK